MQIIVSHPTGNEFCKAAVKGFAKANMLRSYYTALASFPGSLSYKLGSAKWLADIRRRSLENWLKPYVHTRPWKEAGRLMAIKAGAKRFTEHEQGIFSVDRIYADLDVHVAKKLEYEKRQGASAIYAYEDGAVNSFCKAKKLGFFCFYDLPIGYWRALRTLVQEEKELNPDWAVTMAGLKDSEEKLSRKDAEIALADKIIVAGSFTAGTLKNYPGNMPAVQIVPYGFPGISAKNYTSFKTPSKIKLLFVGGLTQRKGLSYLFEALRDLDRFIELTVIGRLPQITCGPLNSELSKHRYISSLPHEKILRLMQEHDVLIFPSLFEGFGQVITEAMAQGTPVITTERTAGPDIIRHGENGWLVNAGSAEAIKNILEQIITRPSLIAELGTQALETAKKRPWSVYGEELVAAVMEVERQ